MDNTHSHPRSRERLFERAGPNRKIIKRIAERFGVTVNNSTVSNWRYGKHCPPARYYPLIAEMAECSLETFFDWYHPNSRGRE